MLVGCWFVGGARVNERAGDSRAMQGWSHESKARQVELRKAQNDSRCNVSMMPFLPKQLDEQTKGPHGGTNCRMTHSFHHNRQTAWKPLRVLETAPTALQATPTVSCTPTLLQMLRNKRRTKGVRGGRLFERIRGWSRESKARQV